MVVGAILELTTAASGSSGSSGSSSTLRRTARLLIKEDSVIVRHRREIWRHKACGLRLQLELQS